MNVKTHLLIISLVLAVLIATIHHVALEFYFYWLFPWLDIVMHFLGGLWVSVTALWAAMHFSFLSVENFSAKKMFGVAILAIILVGIGWEIFELSTGIPREENFVFDTTLDLIMDLIGACVGWWYTKNLFRKKMLVTEQNTELENTELELHEEI